MSQMKIDAIRRIKRRINELEKERDVSVLKSVSLNLYR